MQRQYWRWLWLWVSVLVAGCGQVWSSDRTPPAPRDTTLPLFGYTLVPPALAPTSSVLTATPRLTAQGLGLSPAALYLNVSSPVCYETAVNSLMCLGQVYNPLDFPIEQISVIVQLVAADGTLLAERETSVARAIIPAGRSGPYRALFETVPEGYVIAHAIAQRGEAVYDADRRYADLVLQQVSGMFVNDHYRVTLSIINRSPSPARHLAVTMTLLDRNGQVTGFRQVYLDPERLLQPQETLSLTLRVIPQGADTVAFDTFAEGQLVPN